MTAYTSISYLLEREDLSADEKEALQALQIYMVCMGLANHYATITYGALAAKIGKPGYARHLNKSLARLWHWCDSRGLPQIGHIIINNRTGIPGHGAAINDYAAQKMTVYHFRWYDLLPPTIDELKAESNEF